MEYAEGPGKTSPPLMYVVDKLKLGATYGGMQSRTDNYCGVIVAMCSMTISATFLLSARTASTSLWKWMPAHMRELPVSSAASIRASLSAGKNEANTVATSAVGQLYRPYEVDWNLAILDIHHHPCNRYACMGENCCARIRQKSWNSADSDAMLKYRHLTFFASKPSLSRSLADLTIPNHKKLTAYTQVFSTWQAL
jgi:hypothetical protein